MPRPTLLAVSHGTSDAAGAASIDALVTAVAAALPDVRVRAAFVDVQQPDAVSALAATPGPAVVVPLLSMAFALVSLVVGILLALGASVPISPYVTTISFLIWGVCVLVGRRRRDRRTLGAREVAAA